MIYRAVVACLLALSHSAVNGQPPQPPSRPAQSKRLPNQIKAHLDKNFPGWEYLITSGACNSHLRKAVITGYFNGDNIEDYILKIEYNSKGIVLGFVSSGEGGYKPTESIIKNATSAVKSTGFGFANTGRTVITEQGKRVKLANDALISWPCPNDRQYTYWVYKNGGFNSL
jgi:hypothetical protein